MRRFERSGRGGKSSGRSEYSGPSRFGRRESSDDNGESGRGFSRKAPMRSSGKSFQMHRVTCDKCGQECEVPFRPTSGKPVFCSDCFRKGGEKEQRSPRQYSKPHFNEPVEKTEPEKSENYQYEFDKINEKLNKILSALGLDDD